MNTAMFYPFREDALKLMAISLTILGQDTHLRFQPVNFIDFLNLLPANSTGI